jgi:hypothetical protein
VETKHWLLFSTEISGVTASTYVLTVMRANHRKYLGFEILAAL